MVSRARGKRLPISAWQVESLRLTTFPVPASPVGDVDWWERNREKRDRDNAQLEREYQERIKRGK